MVEDTTLSQDQIKSRQAGREDDKIRSKRIDDKLTADIATLDAANDKQPSGRPTDYNDMTVAELTDEIEDLQSRMLAFQMEAGDLKLEIEKVLTIRRNKR